MFSSIAVHEYKVISNTADLEQSTNVDSVKTGLNFKVIDGPPVELIQRPIASEERLRKTVDPVHI
jgi:hypothetical protein